MDFFVSFVFPNAQVDSALSGVGNHVSNRTTVDETRVDRDTAIPVVEFLDCEQELHHSEVSVATAFRIVTGVSGNTVERSVVNGRALTSANQFTAFTSRFEDQSAVRLGSAFFQPVVGANGTRFFVRIESDQDSQLVQRFLRQLLQSVDDRHQTGLAVQNARAVSAVTVDRHRTFSNRTGLENRIQVAVEHHVEAFGTRLVGSVNSGANVVSQVHQFCRKTDFFQMTNERLSNRLHTFDASRTAVNVNNFFEVLEILLNHWSIPFEIC